MDWLSLDGINWIGVVVAFFATFVIGWVLYSNVGFFRTWKRLGNITDSEIENANMGVAFGGVVAANLLGIVLLAVLMNATGATTVAAGAVLGGLVGLVFRGGAHAGHNGFAIRHPGITGLDTLADTIGLAVAGAILAAFI